MFALSPSGCGVDNTFSISASFRRMIWLGDLNYRINLPYEKARELISKKKWSELVESDQVHFCNFG